MLLLPPKMADLVTQLQTEINRLSELMFGAIGELQRDAGPVPVSGEALLAQPTVEGYNAAARSQGFARDMISICKNIREFTERLPPVSEEHNQERIARITQLQQLNESLRHELSKEKSRTQVKLRLAEDLAGVLADAALRRSCKA
jgi:hypothetical protein